MKHTPGPWKVIEESGDKHGKYPDQIKRWIIDSKTRGCMAILEAYKSEDDTNIWEEVRANACLISYAPEMLEALKDIIDLSWRGFYRYPRSEEEREILKKTDRLIKKLKENNNEKD